MLDVDSASMRYAHIFFCCCCRFVSSIHIFLTRFSVCVCKRMAGWCTIYKMVCGANVWRFVGGEEAKPYRCVWVCVCSAVMVPHAADVLVPMSIYWSCVYAFVLTLLPKIRMVYKPWLAVELRKVDRPHKNQTTHTTQGCITYMPFPMNF